MYEIIVQMANKNIGSLCLFLNNKKNILYLNYLNSIVTIDDISMSEKVYHFVNGINEPILCICGKKRLFIGFKNGHRNSCGAKECSIIMRRETCLSKYGVDNPKKSKDILFKEKENINKKWNGEHYMNNKGVRNKFKKTMLEKWGVEWAQQSIEISQKSKDTFNKNENKNDIILKRSTSFKNKTVVEKNIISDKRKKTIITKYGSENNYINEINKKIKITSNIKYNVDHFLMSDDIIKKRIQNYKNVITNRIESILPLNILYINRSGNKNSTDSYIELYCNICSNNFRITRQLMFLRHSLNSDICLYCNPIISGKSNMELELFDFISKNYYGNIIKNTKKIIDKELDIYLPDLKLAFEFNGLYWHSEEYKERNYHLDKTKLCSEKGIQLIHIWEDDWLYKQDIVKSMILSRLGKTPSKIYARKCIVKEVINTNQIRDFLSKNHIQGFVGSKIKLGLYYNDELVSLMTFGNLRKSLGQISKSGSYELLRFCNILNTTVIGGASKIFYFFLKNFKVNQVISYSDLSRSVGNMYTKLGFILSHNSEPNYYYIIDGIRKHRFGFRKDKLISDGFDASKTEIQIMKDRGLFRIFDCGIQKWIYTNK